MNKEHAINRKRTKRTQTDEDFAYANQELAQLADTAIGEVATVTKNVSRLVDAPLLEKGKVGRNQPSCR